MTTLGINGNHNKRFIFIERALLQPNGELSVVQWKYCVGFEEQFYFSKEKITSSKI
jgi:hypothetical protein